SGGGMALGGCSVGAYLYVPQGPGKPGVFDYIVELGYPNLANQVGSTMNVASTEGGYIGGSALLNDDGLSRVAVRWEDKSPELVADLLAASGGSLSGWHLEEVEGMSADGQTLFVSATGEAGRRDFILRLH